MPHLPKETAYEFFLKFGRNSSHFVWFVTDVKFFRAGDLIFAYREEKGSRLFALEPLVLRAGDQPYDAAEFQRAWAELESEIGRAVSLFVSVYGAFREVLLAAGFQTLQVGREPYVALSDCVPKGNSGKGVRAARNQALRSGVSVEEWNETQVLSHPTMERDMKQILRYWKDRNLVDLGGFLNTVAPFEKMQHRRYFVATTAKDGLEGFLVATPIPGRNSYFLEDMVIRPGAARGTGELLTLETMVALQEHGAEFASLGVVSITSITQESGTGMPPFARFVLIKLPGFFKRFYNVDGLEMFRKRFKPHHWEEIYLAVRNPPGSTVGDSKAWLASVFALLRSFRPRLHLTRQWIWETVSGPFRDHPVSTVMGLAYLASFGFINHGGELPKETLNRYGFSGSAPFAEWPIRTITSDFLFFDILHFVTSAIPIYFLLRWMEKKNSPLFVASAVLLGSFFDDFINQLVLIQPFQLFRPAVFEHLLVVKDVGPSLWAAAVLGFQLCTMQRNREIVFSVVVIGAILTLVLSTSHLTSLILNLNHILFLAFGFILGKLRFEHQRRQSREVARLKPPVAKSVRTQAPKEKKKRPAEGEPPIEMEKLENPSDEPV